MKMLAVTSVRIPGLVTIGQVLATVTILYPSVTLITNYKVRVR